MRLRIYPPLYFTILLPSFAGHFSSTHMLKSVFSSLPPLPPISAFLFRLEKINKIEKKYYKCSKK